MRFETIHDFYEKGKVCPLCKNETHIFFNTRDTGGFIDYEFRNPEGFARFLSRQDMYTAEYAEKAGRYVSNVEGDQITYWYKGNPDNIVDIMKDSHFGINMYDNSIEGDTSMICNLMWRHNLSLCVRCVNEWCFGSGFLFTYNSKPLTIESKSKKLSPLILESHMFGVPNKDEHTNASVAFMTLNHCEETFIVNRYKIVATIPRIDLFSIRDLKELERKLKTFLLFS